MGIIDQQQQPQVPGANPGAAPGGPVAGGGPQAAAPEERETMDNLGLGDQATEEEQAQYDQIIVAGTEILYADETHDQIVKLLTDGAQTPEQTIAQVVVMLVTQIDQATGNTIPEDMILPPVAEFVEQVAELANESGAFAVDERLLQRSAQAALLQVGDAYEVEPEELQEFIDKLGEEKANAIYAEQSAYTNDPGVGPGQPAGPTPGQQEGAV